MIFIGSSQARVEVETNVIRLTLSATLEIQGEAVTVRGDPEDNDKDVMNLKLCIQVHQ